jgi:hypothetical protein
MRCQLVLRSGNVQYPVHSQHQAAQVGEKLLQGLSDLFVLPQPVQEFVASVVCIWLPAHLPKLCS